MCVYKKGNKHIDEIRIMPRIREDRMFLMWQTCVALFPNLVSQLSFLPQCWLCLLCMLTMFVIVDFKQNHKYLNFSSFLFNFQQFVLSISSSDRPSTIIFGHNLRLARESENLSEQKGR
jgi:Ca2+/Na+ antiporter